MSLQWLQLGVWPLPVESAVGLHPQHQWPLCSRALEPLFHRWSGLYLWFPAEVRRQKRGRRLRSEAKVPSLTIQPTNRSPPRSTQKQEKHPVTLTQPFRHDSNCSGKWPSPWLSISLWYLCVENVAELVQVRKPTETYPGLKATFASITSSS